VVVNEFAKVGKEFEEKRRQIFQTDCFHIFAKRARGGREFKRKMYRH
jgi:hypothetical protein